MHVAGIDAHATYIVVAVVGNDGVVQKPARIRNNDPERLIELLLGLQPLEVVVEASPAWPVAVRSAGRFGRAGDCSA